MSIAIQMPSATAPSRATRLRGSRRGTWISS